MKFTEYKYQVGAQFNVALAYGDISGLDDIEIGDLDRFEADLPAGNGLWDFAGDECPEFGMCEVTDKMTDVIEVSYVVKVD